MNPKTSNLFNNNKCLILTKEVKQRWVGPSITYYTKMGYNYTKLYDYFIVPIQDLIHSSSIEIEIQCPICNRTRKKPFKKVVNIQHTICQSCCCKGRAHDLTGKKFNRLLVVSRHEIKNGFFNCICNCGKQVVVKGAALTFGAIKSCGCYHIDQLKTWVGDKHPNWNFNKSDEDRIKRRHYYKNHVWKKEVKHIFNNCCDVCGLMEKTMIAHHLYSWATHKHLRFETSNGACLCDSCHKMFHIIFKKRNNTLEQYQEFKSNFNKVMPIYVLIIFLKTTYFIRLGNMFFGFLNDP
ncbi:MAG: HNH endonuclease [Candidatus Pacearchaeota archaeon]